MQSCRICDVRKPVEDFYKDKSSKSGYRSACKECELLDKKQYYQCNKERIENYKKNNAEHIKETYRQYEKNRYSGDVDFKLRKRLRGRIKDALRNGQKSGSAVKDLGCSVRELKKYLESKFYPNPETGEKMSWENYGFYGWHIDHIKLLSLFDLTNREQFLEACHYTNLQPLWAAENFSKKKK